MTQTLWSSGVTDWLNGLASLRAAPLDLALFGLAVAGCLLLAACALGLRSVARELAAGRSENARTVLALHEMEDLVATAAGELEKIGERLEKTVPPEIHVDSIVARQLEIRAGAGMNGSSKRPNPNLVVHDFD